MGGYERIGYESLYFMSAYYVLCQQTDVLIHDTHIIVTILQVLFQQFVNMSDRSDTIQLLIYPEGRKFKELQLSSLQMSAQVLCIIAIV